MQRVTGVCWLVMLALLSGTAVSAEDYRPGDEVVVIEDANLTVSGNKVVDSVGPGQVLTVQDVNGEWLWLSNGKPGYLSRNKVMPLNRGALDRLTEMIEANPRSARLYSGRAKVWKNLGELDIALGDYNEAIRLDPSAAYHSNRGNVWNAKQEYDKAIADYNEAIRLNPSAAYYHNRGLAWYSEQEYDKALLDYSEALRLDPRNAAAHNGRGIVWHVKQEYDKAIADYNEALRLDPNDSRAYGNRGVAWSRKLEYDKALADYDEAIRLDPKNSFAVYDRGVISLVLRKKNAYADFQRVLEIESGKGSRSCYAIILGHLAARLLGDDQRATQFLEDHWRQLPSVWPTPTVTFLRGEIGEAAYLALADTNDKLTDAHCFLGLKALADQRSEPARTHFEWVRDQGNKAFTEYRIAIAELKRLDRK